MRLKYLSFLIFFLIFFSFQKTLYSKECISGNCVDGKGTLIFPENKKKKIDENTFYDLSNAIKYEGDFKNNKANGQGTMTWSDGSKYVGQFKDDKANGQGTMIFAVKPETKYVGEFKDDKLHGKGTLTDSEGFKHVGEFKDDKANGKGIVTTSDGYKYVGDFKDDLLHGQGTETYDGVKYVGEFKNNERHGKGTLNMKNGQKYVGDFDKGKMSGNGILYNPDGNIYSGGFKDNALHGKVQIDFPDGRKLIGEWKDGTRVKAQFVDSTGKKISNFKRTVICKNKYNIVNMFKFKDNKVVTKSSGPGGKLKVVQSFSNVPFVKKKNIIEWKGTYVSSKGIKVPVKYSFDLKSMSLYTDLNIMNLSNPKKIKIDTVCG